MYIVSPRKSLHHTRVSHALPDINVTGTSSGNEGSVVVDLECSDVCQDITAVDTNLTSPSGNATYVCVNIASAAKLDFNCSSPA